MAEENDLVISAGFSDAQLVKEANKVVAFYAAKGQEAQKAFVDAQAKVPTRQAAQAHVREVDRLAKAYDPAYRAAARYQDEVKRLDRALKIGSVTQDQHTAAVTRAARQWKQAGEVADETAKGTGRFGGSMQQVGYQVGDFAVQVGAGTSAVQALGQQLPQLLGAFGTFGALAGAAAAIGIPLGAALYRIATDSKTLEERTTELTKSTDDYVAAAKEAITPVADLALQYGDLADEVTRANSTLALLTGLRARQDLFGAAAGLGDTLGGDLTPEAAPVGGDGQALLNFEFMQRQQLEKDMRRIQDLTGATADQFDQLRMAITRVESSNSVDAVARDAENLLGIIGQLSANDGADQNFLLGWAQQVGAVLAQAQRQIEAGIDPMIAEQARIVDAYQTDTDKLKTLSDDRVVAQSLVADALKSGNAAAVEQAQERLRLIDREIDQTRALARETDTAFQGMLSAYQQYADSRKAGNEWAASPAGFEAQYVAARASGAGSAEEELVRAVTALAEQMDISAKDLLAVMSFETGGTLRPDVRGGKDDQYIGLIQFSPTNQRNLGVSQQSTITEQVIAAGKYLQDAGVKAGDSLANIYAAVLSGDARNVNASDLAAGGVVGNVTAATGGDQFAPHIARAEGLLAAYGGIAQAAEDDAQAADKALKDQIRERERLAKQAKDYGDQLAQNLLTQQQAADLDRAQNENVAAIKGLGLDPEAEARAIAQVTAEIERQRLVMSLHADAKRRNVDLDAMLADGSMTYRAAIEALGQAKVADILATDARAAAEDRAGAAAGFYADQQERVQVGLVQSILAGTSFSDVLRNVALSFAEAKLQAALFNSGAMATAGGGGGWWGIVKSGISGFFGGGDALSGALRTAGLPARAAGGPVSAGTAYMVGERGPEPFVPAVDGRILSVAQAQQAIRGGGGGHRSMSMVVDLRGTTGDRELDAKLRASAQAILRQVPATMAEHQKRDS